LIEKAFGITPKAFFIAASALYYPDVE